MNHPQAKPTASRHRTYRLQPATIAALDALAAQTNLTKDTLADALLYRALAKVGAGKWTIRRRAASWELEDVIADQD